MISLLDLAWTSGNGPAIDLELSVEVALEANVAERFTDPHALLLLHGEVRSVLDASSPNVTQYPDDLCYDGDVAPSSQALSTQELETGSGGARYRGNSRWPFYSRVSVSIPRGRR